MSKPIPFADVLAATALTAAEIGAMPPEQRAEYDDLQGRVVFGHDAKKDRHGNWIPQGVGSPGNENVNHWAALRAAERRGLEKPGTTERLMAEAAKRKGAHS
jgi:hypothetical protein